jgi:hypothetical protein
VDIREKKVGAEGVNKFEKGIIFPFWKFMCSRHISI